MRQVVFFSSFLFFFFLFSELFAFSDAYITDLEENLRFLYGRVEELEKKVDLLIEYSGDIGYSKYDDEYSFQKESITPSAASNEIKDVKVTNQEREDYQAAFNMLRLGDNLGAEKAFVEFTKTYPDSDLIGNAFFWLGELYYSSNKDYNKSSKYFLKAYKNSVTPSKKHASLYKLAISLNEVGNSKQACRVIEKLLKEYKGDMSTLLQRDAERYISKIENCDISV
ncbi:tetratricopeptide repeat protein [Anaplasmataceae bacterium AB001_6]|nr:tetratricopeptide repeat protein [Anaplasmataceae bacterium AB001_6]